jgi:hypothetical protein
VEETAFWTLRILAFLGVALFLWSVATSFETLAQAFVRIAKAMEKDSGLTPTAQPKA